jgi:5-methylcytosine-specific restriction endonuclease McrA
LQDNQSLNSLSDDALRVRLRELASSERRLSGDLLRHLGEYDARELFREDGFQNLWTYCARALRFAQAEIGLRIAAAKAVHANPDLLGMLERGEMTLSAIGRLAPHLKGERAKPLIEQAKGMSFNEVRWLIATEKATEKVEAAKADAAAQAAVQSGLFDPGGAPMEEAAIRAELRGDFDRVVPLSGERARLEAVVSRTFVKKLERAQVLLARRFPKGRLEDVLGVALELLLDREDPERREARRQARFARRGFETPYTSRGRRTSRRLRDRVLQRDGHRCTALEADLTRCRETKFLELNHRKPLALGGETTYENLEATCVRHNREAAIEVLGRERVTAATQARRSRKEAGEAAA